MPEFDVVVLGGGTSGVLIASELAAASRSVAVVEAGLVGGESAFLADMPAASLLASAQRGETWEQAVSRRDEITARLDDSPQAARLAERGVTLVRGTGRVTGPGVVEVTPIARAAMSAEGREPPAPPCSATTTLSSLPEPSRSRHRWKGSPTCPCGPAHRR